MKHTRKKSHHPRPKPLGVAVFSTTSVQGEVTILPYGAHAVRIHATFTKLPSGNHGFHIHMAGDLRGEGCKGACAHYHVGPPQSHGDAPNGTTHQRHTGDLGNIAMPNKGPFQKQWIVKGTTVEDLWGRSIIVHEDADDLGLGPHDDSKTTGHSGARIACAVIGRGICSASK